MTPRRLSKHLILLALIAVAATGCGKVDLYSNLQEREVNEMMAVLQKEGISCAKTAGEENTWTVAVPSADFARAVDSLKSLGYPKDNYADMGEIFKKSGLVSSPTEERIRYVHGLEQGIAETISQIDGVLTARVHVSLPENDPFVEVANAKPASAAVFIKHRHDADLQTKIPEITQLVSDAIEGLDYEHVTLATFAAENPAELPSSEIAQPEYAEVLSLRLAPESVERFWSMFGGLAVVAGVNFLLALGVMFYARRATRTRAQAAGA